MADRSKDTWYVSFEPRKLPGKRAHHRATERFPNEFEAKKFAKAKLADTTNVSAGTLNPRLPKRTIASTQIVQWLLELDDPDVVCWPLLRCHDQIPLEKGQAALQPDPDASLPG